MPHCAHVLEQPPELATIQTEYAPQKPLEPSHDLPIPGSKWPCMITGGITTAFALLLLPLIFIPDGNEPLDMAGVWTGVVLLLILLGFGLILLFCRHKEPEETKQPIGHCAGTENNRCAWEHPVVPFPCNDAYSRYRAGIPPFGRLP